MRIYVKGIKQQKNLANFKTNQNYPSKCQCLQYLPLGTAL